MNNNHDSSLIKLLKIGLLACILSACSSKYPDESDIASAWQFTQPDSGALFTSDAIKNLKCVEDKDDVMQCYYVMGKINHAEGLKKNASGHWELLNKKGEN